MLDITKSSFGQRIPSVFIRSVVLSPILPSHAQTSKATPRGFTASVNLVLKVLNGAPTEHFHNRLRMMVCMITNRDHARNILSNPRALKQDIRSPRSHPGMPKKYISFEDSCECSCGDPKKKEVVNTRESAYVQNYSYQVKFDLPGNAYNYLSCLVVPYYANSDSAANRVKNINFPVGIPRIEDVLIGNQSQKRRFIFRLAETMSGFGTSGEIYAGPVHYHAGKYMAGYIHHDKAHPKLSREQVSNKKIIDRRYERQLGATKRRNAIQKLEMLNQRASKNLLVRKMLSSRDYFSPIEYSRQADNTLRLLFSADKLKMAKNSIQYSHLYNSDQESLNAIEIKDVILYRRRVTHYPGNNKLSGIPPANRWFDSNEKESAVCSLKKGNLSCLGSHASQPGIFNFVGEDREIGSFIDGLYRYSVKVRYIDKSSIKFLKLLKDLTNSSKRFDKFIKIASLPGGYNCDSKSFSPSRIKELYLISGSPWKNVAIDYISALTAFAGVNSLAPLGADGWLKTLLSLTDPVSADLSSLMTVKRLVGSLLGKLNYALNKPTVSGNEEALSFRSKISYASPGSNSYVEVKHKFLSAYNTKGKANLGLEYMPNIAYGRGRLPRFSWRQWNARINTEKAKYTVAHPENQYYNLTGYISPQAIRIPLGSARDGKVEEAPGAYVGWNKKSDIPVNMALPARDNRSLKFIAVTSMMLPSDGLTIALAKRSQTGRLNFSNDHNTDLATQRRKLLGSQGITVTALPRGIASQIEENNGCFPLVRASELVGGNSRFLKQCEDEKEKPRILNSMDPDDPAAATELAGILTEDVMSFFGSVSMDLSQIPDSLAASDPRRNSGQSGTATMGQLSKYMLFDSVVKVESLQGYRNGNVGDPIWKTLTEKDFGESGLGAGEYLICRLRENNNQNIFTLPAYNQVFVIGNTPKQSKSVSNVISEGQKYSDNRRRLQNFAEYSVISSNLMNLPMEYLVSREAMRLLSGRSSDRSAPTRPAGTPTRPGGGKGSSGGSKSGMTSGGGGKY